MENNLLLSKFWTRIGALLIDSFVLGIVGFILGVIFKNFFISLGENAKLIGWFISLSYFSILNSNIHNGQTLGKKLMHIQVTDITGNTVSLKTSFIRALVYTTPFFLNGFKIPGSHLFSVITVIQGIIIFTVGTGIIIFYIFNKETRQSLHDIVAKTYVVQEVRSSTISFMPAIKKRSFYITGGVFLLVIITSIYGLSSSNSEIKKLVPVYEDILKQDHISDATVSMNTNPFSDNSDTKYLYIISIKVDRNLKNDKNTGNNINTPEIRKAVETFINSNVYDSDNEILTIVINSGFDIGIAKQFFSYSHSKTIHEWKRIYNK
ncbi:RDD family protein [Chryseobacterium sp. SSA4.19]|uniref:RDD family protein n=1 Tax=Chryseobacterium sp. SSA4.19 TaxID=2919915 RepID=UPI001F4EEF82|nr:RDD family protein [Chryseobacterium sp. SSA4.19]MCJ8155506.1 RDD family protein [Chryseobacterium sp. SSA4.19]